ncbi:MAG TPA: hypothetical protein VFR06_01500 [Gallionellaceae bacterium]|nr:hypothetical protein [Gallionellaceae bacterium]
MIVEVTDAECKQAQLPQNLFGSGVLLFALLLAQAAIVMDIGLYGLLLQLGCSLLLAWLLTLASHDPHMKHIILTALTRIAVLPTLVAVMVTVVMAAGALAQAGRSEMPDRIVRNFPPPG